MSPKRFVGNIRKTSNAKYSSGIGADIRSTLKNNSQRRQLLRTSFESQNVANDMELNFDRDSRPTNYRQPTSPSSVPIKRIFRSYFPLSALDSFKDYFLRLSPFKAQHELLSSLDFYPEPSPDGRCGKIMKVPVGSGNFINEFYIESAKAGAGQRMKHLILIHGYGAGLGFFLKNFESLSKVNGWCIHAIDLLGYGLSSRPKFRPKTNDLDGVESWFHDSFKQWLTERGLDQVPSSDILVAAHSMGAYLMYTYGIKVDADYCKKLIMVSPGAVIKNRRKIEIPQYFKYLWEKNVSPFTLVRRAGPYGSKLVSGWSSRRFSNLSLKEASLLHKYAYSIFSRRGSGEYMLNYLLAPGADARFPLIERGIEKVNFDLTWCYGDGDWMDRTGGELCSQIINKAHNNYKKSKVVIFSNAGHHLYLDTPKVFGSYLEKEMQNL